MLVTMLLTLGFPLMYIRLGALEAEVGVLYAQLAESTVENSQLAAKRDAEARQWDAARPVEGLLTNSRPSKGSPAAKVKDDLRTELELKDQALKEVQAQKQMLVEQAAAQHKKLQEEISSRNETSCRRHILRNF